MHREPEPPSAIASSAGVELGEVRHDERAGCGRRRRTRVRGEVAERRVLLVTDRRNDGTREAATARTTASSLNGRRSSKLPPPRASTTTSTSGCAASARERGDDRVRGALALHARLAHDDLRRREPRTDRRDEVAARRGVRPGEDPDRARDARQPALPLDGEEPLGGELPLQLLERDEMTAEADPLDRRRAEPELAL